MKLIKVTSSNISQIGFEINRINSMNARPINVLRVIFNSGYIYEYYDVEKTVYEDLLNAKSLGAFFHQNIKDEYQFEKVS